MAIGLAGQAVGLILVAVGVRVEDLTSFLIGGAIAGAGAGILFKAAVGTVAAMARPENRGEALATLFLGGYLGVIVPALGLGFATQLVSLQTAMMWFAAVILVLIGGAALAAWRARSASPQAA
jgi:MFS family permease